MLIIPIKTVRLPGEDLHRGKLYRISKYRTGDYYVYYPYLNHGGWLPDRLLRKNSMDKIMNSIKNQTVLVLPKSYGRKLGVKEC